MGKQSKRKGGGRGGGGAGNKRKSSSSSSSSSHKERQQQRRERVEDHLNSEQQYHREDEREDRRGAAGAGAGTAGAGTAGGGGAAKKILLSKFLCCPNCGSKDNIGYHPSSGNNVCVECGVVVEDNTIESGKQQQQQQQQHHHRQQEGQRRPFLTGDHVISLVVNGCDVPDEARPEDNHGIIHDLEFGEDGEEICYFVPIKDFDWTGGKILKEHVWSDPTDKLIINWWGWTLRFEVGDKVLCCTSYGWVPAIVTYQWPVHRLPKHRRVHPKHRDDDMVFYECKSLAAEDDDDDDDDEELPLFVPRDSDDCIMKDPPTFRFTIGTKVIVSIRHAIITHSNNKKRGGYNNNDSWIEGTISQVRVLGLPYFAYYECNCSLVSGKTLTCHIVKDDDEHVANASSSPRERFLEAIEQNCSLDHLNYLTNTLEGGIDVSTFQGIVLKRAIATASYNGLLWLKTHLGVDLNKVEDEHGNALLHQIAKSPNVMSFLKSASELSFAEYGVPYIELRYVEGRLGNMPTVGMIYRKNGSDQTWLHILAQEGNIKALDFVFNPLHGIFWLYMRCERDDYEGIVDMCNKSSTVRCDFIRPMVDEFLASDTARIQLDYMRMRFVSASEMVTEDEFLNRGVMAEFSSSMDDAIRCVRFCRDWEDHHKDLPTLSNVLFKLASFGYYRTLRQMVEAGATFDSREYQNSRQDKDEFVQPELQPTEGRYNSEEFTIISGLVHGDWLPGLSILPDQFRREFPWYLRTVHECMALNGDLATHLNDQIVNANSSSYRDYVKEVRPFAFIK